MGTSVHLRNLRHIDPAHGAPTKLEEAGVEENADKRKVTGSRYGLALNRWVNAHVETNVEHGETLGDRSPKERTAATKRVSSEDEESKAANHLDDAVDSSGEELILVTLETKGPEEIKFRNPETVAFRFSLCICRYFGEAAVETETKIWKV